MPPIPVSLPAAMRALALTGEQESHAQIPGLLQMLLLHILAMLYARPAHAPGHATWLFRAGAPLVNAALAAPLALPGHAPESASTPLPPIRRRGADEIIIALAHRGPPRNPSRPARMPPARPRPARDPPCHQQAQVPPERALARVATPCLINYDIANL